MRILFHRIGAVNTVDVFEAVTYSGSGWFVFFLDMYHPRRSRQAPEGFVIAKEPRQFSGFHNYCKNFPYDFVEAKQESPDMLRLAYIPLSHVTGKGVARCFCESRRGGAPCAGEQSRADRRHRSCSIRLRTVQSARFRKTGF